MTAIIKIVLSILLLVKKTSSFSAFKTSASNLDGLKLSDDEKSTIGVYRMSSPSVAYVTSVMLPLRGAANVTSPQRGLTGLGSGSGFVVDDDGYIITNYHVVQRAWEMNSMGSDAVNALFPPQVYGNKTMKAPAFVPGALVDFAEEQRKKIQDRPPRAQVLVRVNSASEYKRANIIDVVPELDTAVLQVEQTDGKTESFQSLPIGSSTDLLVGQKVVAIGNPFGLDKTVTTGVVSALNREVTGVAGNQIRNCVQTDAAINPGNSGGPLLNNECEVIGVNTAIISTSGSNAGIGFAIPIDSVISKTKDIISKHRIQTKKRPAPGWLGLTICSNEMKKELLKQMPTMEPSGLLIMSVASNSPAFEAGIKGLILTDNNCTIGDRIVAVDGNTIDEQADIELYFSRRVVNEKVNMTLEAPDGRRRIVEMTMSTKKLL